MRNKALAVSMEIALAVALAWVLNMPPLRFWTMPQGGELSLVMLPVIVIALRHGLGSGLLAGALVSIPVYFTEPYVVHPAQYILDYPLAYGLVGLAGILHPLWRRFVAAGKMQTGIFVAILPAVFVGAAGRYLSHLVSGAVFFGEYAPEGQPVWVYSAIYNLYVPLSAAACFVAAAMLLPALARALGSSSESVTA